MIKLLVKDLILLSLICFISSCSSKPPVWVDTHPQDQQYWHGIGFASHSNGEFTKAIAKEYAIQEISSQIKVNISSEMDIAVTDFNGSVNNVISSVMKSRVELLLPELEFVGQHNTKKGLYFYIRLNKVNYNAAMVRLRENAKQTALGYIKEADQNFGVRSLKLVQKAWQEILPFNDEPIEVVYDSQPVHLYYLIKSKFEEYSNRIELEALIDKKTIRTFIDRENSITIRVKDKENGNFIGGVPVELNIKDKDYTVYSDSDGLVRYNMSSFPYTTSLNIQFQLNLDEIYKSLNTNENVLSLNSKISSVIINVTPARAVIESLEKNLNKTLNEPIIMIAIKESLNNKVEFVNTKSDILIKIDANTSKRSDRVADNFPYFSYGNASVKFEDAKTNEIFFTASISDIKGADFGSQQTAGIRSYEKMAISLVSELEKELFDNVWNQ